MLRVSTCNVYVQKQTAVTAETPTVMEHIRVKAVLLDSNDWNVKTVSTVVGYGIMFDNNCRIPPPGPKRSGSTQSESGILRS